MAKPRKTVSPAPSSPSSAAVRGPHEIMLQRVEALRQGLLSRPPVAGARNLVYAPDNEVQSAVMAALLAAADLPGIDMVRFNIPSGRVVVLSPAGDLLVADFAGFTMGSPEGTLSPLRPWGASSSSLEEMEYMATALETLLEHYAETLVPASGKRAGAPLKREVARVAALRKSSRKLAIEYKKASGKALEDKTYVDPSLEDIELEALEAQALEVDI